MLHQPNPREALDPKANGKLYEKVRRSMLKYNNLIKKQYSVKDQTSGEECNKEVKEPASKRRFSIVST
ncbi:AGAP006618-PA-like protein [Anopheles sinensis]|uniref:AGAP006618-PA-like protein n=1 Tax=Anopheles sinensis TaxID=74873 RepID=A0A084WGK2_ANOSI|nr:AGAP006618-PA-like protein [Anopheles sinensis]